MKPGCKPLRQTQNALRVWRAAGFGAATAVRVTGAITDAPPQSIVSPVELLTKPGCGPVRPTQNADNVWRAGAGAITGAGGGVTTGVIWADRTTGAGAVTRGLIRGGVVVEATVRIGAPTLRAGFGAGAGAAITGAGTGVAAAKLGWKLQSCWRFPHE